MKHRYGEHRYERNFGLGIDADILLGKANRLDTWEITSNDRVLGVDRPVYAVAEHWQSPGSTNVC